MQKADWLEVLKRIESSYRVSMNTQDWSDKEQDALQYLVDHGLAEELGNFRALGSTIIGFVKITARGLDYLSEDGGLSSELNKITVQIDEEQFRQLLLTTISNADMALEEKSILQDLIHDLSLEALKNLAKKVLELGLSKQQELLQLIQTASAGVGPIL